MHKAKQKDYNTAQYNLVRIFRRKVLSVILMLIHKVL